MKILVLGLPGSGKSTQVDKLAEYLDVPSLKMGAILRQIVESDSELGRQIKEVMLQGHLVKDEIVEDIIRQECKKLTDGFVMEGYPRTIHQIDNFDPGFDKVFYLKIDTQEAHQRMYARAREDDKCSEWFVDSRREWG
jgi:adenylate kinase